ncbi:Argininosuccinate lyase [Variovorax sp. SRS16]|uniref:Bug family tripartite tricarboxylate transporter substrate binding protein n=1 Tax=Variovorax sp. SRS16 TaxID=282217 RepID=UPI00131833E4|nr:tripartite tricarboxylate transporter substrate binding protein [Variovorax sp. SRS16]VTU13149.1 Argininosuccinate lyase [Variovorax sp. SRS16]
MTARRTFLLAAALAPLAPLGYAASGSDFPQKPIRLIVPFPPGGGVDQIARILGPQLSQALGQSVVIDNQGGAGGAIGAGAVKRANPDGYTLLMGTASTHGSNYVVQKDLPYDPVKDFEPISLLMEAPYVLVANKSVPYDSIAQLNTYANAHAGKVNFGSYGIGSSNHLAAELYKALSGANITHIPYRGAAQAMTALLAGEIDITFDTLPNVVPYLKARTVKALGVGARQRSPLFPDIPTVIESGVPGYISGTWFGVWAPKGTPPGVIRKLDNAFVQSLHKPAVAKIFEDAGNHVLAAGPAALKARVSAEIEGLQRLVKERGLRFD